MMRICVIGAGAAGICAGRRLLEDAEKNGTSGLLEVRIFEKTDKIGGTWVLDEEEEEEKEGIEKCQRKDHHSSMYHNLRANIPTVMMEYEDFPFPPLRHDQTSYLGQHKVLEYLLEFAKPMRHLIQFNTRVLHVRKLTNDHCVKWEVLWEQRKMMPSSSSFKEITETVTEQFDAIFVCNGYYSVPRFPPFIHKIQQQNLPFIHSHDYKRAEHFGGKTVAVVGAGLSGSDIVKQLAKHAKKVYFLHMPAPSKASMENAIDTKNGTMLLALPGYPYFFPSSEKPPNCEEKCRVVDVDARESTLVLADGTKLGAKDGLDCVIFCTGYKYSIPFLEAEGIVQCPEDGSFVSPIWAKFVHVHHPRSFFILGLTFPVLPLFDCQMRLAIALIYGRVNPPELEVMLAEERQRLEELKKQGKPAKYFHQLQLDANGPFGYFDWLNQMAKQPKHRLPVHLAIYRHFRNAQSTTTEYRNVRYVIKNEEEFEVVHVPTK